MVEVHGFDWTIKQLYTYPNEYIYWSVLIVVYPYITGLVAGAFVVSSLYHLFKKEALKPVSRFALLLSLAFLLVAPMPLLLHLQHPERAFNIYWTPNTSSAMAMFGYVWLTYFIILCLEIWFVYRADIVRMAMEYKEKRGFFNRIKYYIYKALTLGYYRIDEEALKLDEKVGKFLSAIGIPAACFLHGYVGFIFGSVKANPLWNTPMMPVIFLVSAVVSGIALTIFSYIIAMKIMKRDIDMVALKTMSYYLVLFILLDFALEMLEILNHAYKQTEDWVVLKNIVFGSFAFTIFGVQFLIGLVIPAIILSLPGLTVRRAFFASILVLIGVLSMRWNVVVGGQSFSKSLYGYMVYDYPIFSTNILILKESVTAVAFLLLLPFILLIIFNKILPAFEFKEEKHSTH